MQEAGGHRIQRVPPTERRGRVHTSTVTISVLFDSKPVMEKSRDEDFEVRFFSGTGKGGQHRNRHQNSVVMTHRPSGLTQTAVGRSKERNLVLARERLEALLAASQEASTAKATNDIRAAQIGCGMRADKKRTYRFQDDSITDHETGKQMTCRAFMRGNIERLWK